eukprot:m.438028 g.438028  ORF g.438028 m.438028 type:complete len:89 (+) comp18184_c0_seq1:3135-3401(+)
MFHSGYSVVGLEDSQFHFLFPNLKVWNLREGISQFHVGEATQWGRTEDPHSSPLPYPTRAFVCICTHPSELSEGVTRVRSDGVGDSGT